MDLISSITAVFALASSFPHALAADSDFEPALTGRYWDCCKPSCAWNGKADFNNPIRSCDARNNPLSDFNVGTGCNGGDAFACSNQSPWAVNDTYAFGFAGVYLRGGTENSWCCSCYELRFTSGNLTGKTMVLQASNTDYDVLTDNMFTLAMPGSNNSDYGACNVQYGMDNSVFGSATVGVSTRDDCDKLPQSQRSGCQFRFDWLQDVQAPNVEFRKVSCPTELTNITGCIRNEETGAASTITSPVRQLVLSSLAILAWLIF